MKRFLMVGALVFVALMAWGQNYSLQPAYGSVTLNAGFHPDPYTVTVVAGGHIDISNLRGVSAYGRVADAPDFDLYYENAGQYRMTIKVDNTRADTILLVNDPSGRWHFNDDTNGLNPAITFNNPQSGLYDIWVGTIDGNTANARLVLTEMD